MRPHSQRCFLLPKREKGRRGDQNWDQQSLSCCLLGGGTSIHLHHGHTERSQAPLPSPCLLSNSAARAIALESHQKDSHNSSTANIHFSTSPWDWGPSEANG